MPTEPLATAGPEIVLHEERLAVGTRPVPVERLVLRRRITTEVRQVEVTVRREVLEVQRDALTDDSATASPAQGRAQEPLVIVLSEEVPVVQLQTRPYERVRVDVETTTEQQRVVGTVGRERAELTTEDVDGAVTTTAVGTVTTTAVGTSTSTSVG